MCPVGRRTDRRRPRALAGGPDPSTGSAALASMFPSISRAPPGPDEGSKAGPKKCNPTTFLGDLLGTRAQIRSYDKGHLAVALEVSVGRFAGLLQALRLVGRDSGGGIRTRDLRVEPDELPDCSTPRRTRSDSRHTPSVSRSPPTRHRLVRAWR